ncbi:MAG: energy-coupling factor transporter ATPase [Coriobacteriia bacterium]|nr:energy-coupling factor transporter ATPase [Coriobacteriia bacterium]
MIKVTNIAALGTVLCDVSLELRPGERLALVGANGSGKSTLLHTIVGLQAVQGGHISVDGLDPFDRKQAQSVRRLVGYVQQRPDDQIVATSVEDDVAFGPENLGLSLQELRSRVDDALAQVGLTGLESREPHTLSGGQKQRLVIAGVLALHPRYLVLDEPTARLDPVGKSDVLDVLAKLQAQGTGILQVTHDIEEMALADRIAVLHQGTIVFEGSYEQLQQQREHFEVWGIDSGLAQVELAPFQGGKQQKYTLRAENCALTYQVGTQKTTALKDASLQVSSGELIVIRGDTGSGKSTLLNILAGLVDPDTGTVEVLQNSDEGNSGGCTTLAADSTNSPGINAAARLVFQDPELQLFSETVLDDIAFGPHNLGLSTEQAKEAAAEAMLQVGLPPEEFGDRSPFLLSGGEARRTAIAGIVAMKPKFFLADEPTSALDAQGRDKVRALIASLTAESGVIVVTHNPEQFVDIATRTYEITDGVLTEAAASKDGEPCSSLLSSVQSASDSVPSAPEQGEGSCVLQSDALDRTEFPESAEASKQSRRKKRSANAMNFSIFIPGDSILHRADPRTKILSAGLLMTALFTNLTWPPILAVFVIAIILVMLAKIPLAPLLRMLRPIAFIIAFTLIFHSIDWATLSFSTSGFLRGGLFTLRLVDVMMLSMLVTFTTSPVALTDGLTLLMKPLRALRVPTDDIAMMLSIALRFIPTIMEEAMTIVKAQTARGAPFSNGSILTRLKAWIPVIIPLLVQLFRRADTLALAMEARCYVAGSDAPVRTRLRTLKLQALDVQILSLAVTVGLAIIILPRILV